MEGLQCAAQFVQQSRGYHCLWLGGTASVEHWYGPLYCCLLWVTLPASADTVPWKQAAAEVTNFCAALTQMSLLPSWKHAWTQVVCLFLIRYNCVGGWHGRGDKSYISVPAVVFWALSSANKELLGALKLEDRPGSFYTRHEGWGAIYKSRSIAGRVSGYPDGLCVFLSWVFMFHALATEGAHGNKQLHA